MKHGLGVAYGKVAPLLATSFGLQLDRSTVARADERLANRLVPTYQCLLLQLRASEGVHVAETGWKVAGRNAWLWVFTNESLSVYTIDPTRAHKELDHLMTLSTAIQNRIQAIDGFAWPGLEAVLSDPFSPLARWVRPPRGPPPQ